MKLILLAAVVGLLMVGSSALDEPCIQGALQMEDCNTCVCADTGRYACTLRTCYQGPQFVDTENDPIAVRPFSKRQTKLAEPCAVGQSYEEDCNTCICTDTGKFVCTQRACYHGPLFPDTIDGPTPAKALRKRQTEPCEPGHVYEKDCNTCTCTSTRIYACTRRACINIPK